MELWRVAWLALVKKYNGMPNACRGVSYESHSRLQAPVRTGSGFTRRMERGTDSTARHEYGVGDSVGIVESVRRPIHRLQFDAVILSGLQLGVVEKFVADHASGFKISV